MGVQSGHIRTPLFALDEGKTPFLVLFDRNRKILVRSVSASFTAVPVERCGLPRIGEQKSDRDKQPPPPGLPPFRWRVNSRLEAELA